MTSRWTGPTETSGGRGLDKQILSEYHTSTELYGSTQSGATSLTPASHGQASGHRKLLLPPVQESSTTTSPHHCHHLRQGSPRKEKPSIFEQGKKFFKEKIKETQEINPSKDLKNYEEERRKKTEKDVQGRKNKTKEDPKAVLQICQEDTKQEAYLRVLKLGTQPGRLPSSLCPWPDGMTGTPASSTSGGWDRECLGTARGAGDTGCLQGGFSTLRGWKEDINSLRRIELSKHAAAHSGAMGLGLPPAHTKTTGAVESAHNLTNHGGRFSIILEAQQGLATPSATSQGTTGPSQNIPRRKSSPTTSHTA